MTDIDYNARISFDAENDIMDVDFSGLTFDVSKPVNAFYDVLDQRLAETGRKWYFLVNYRDCRIMAEAWIAFAHRGKLANLAYSLGSARYAATADTGTAIAESAKTERFDPNLFPQRDAALAHLKAMRSKIPAAEFAETIKLGAAEPQRTIEERITFHPDLEIMEVDYSGVTFATSADVNAYYDLIAAKIAETKRKWYFLVNYDGTEILPDSWYQWTLRGKRLNLEYSLGTVRFDPHGAAREEILKRARADEFDANLVRSRDEALARIAQLRGQS